MAAVQVASTIYYRHDCLKTRAEIGRGPLTPAIGRQPRNVAVHTPPARLRGRDWLAGPHQTREEQGPRHSWEGDIRAMSA